jgi:hypothetical protein
MNLPFAPEGKKEYAPVRLEKAIANAGYEFDDVQVVVPNGDGWLVHFNSTTDVLSVQ